MDYRVFTDTNTKLDISFGSIWEYISITRKFLENFLIASKLSRHAINRITLCASELMENGVKYSDVDGVRLVIEIDENSDEIGVKVFNHASNKNNDRLVQVVTEMNGSNPLQFYLDQMKKSARKRNNRSFLGLARINHEVNARVSTSYSKDKKMVKLEARLKG